MKITHINNAFILVEANGVTIACDPWTGTSNYGTWHAFPIFDDAEIISATKNVDYVYISHVHADHMDPKTLEMCGLTSAKFIINKNPQPTLRRRVESVGPSEIIECEPFTTIDLGALKIATVPQMSRYNVGKESDVDYDIDSSILITDGQKVFFNQVDNPLSVDDFKYIGEWSRKNLGPIKLAAVICGAASEYPHCFMNLDRVAEKMRIELESIKLLIERIDAMQPENIFVSGGSYFIPGRNASLNQYIAVPVFEDVERAVKSTKPDIGVFDIEGGGALRLGDATSAPVESVEMQALHTNLADALNATVALVYEQDLVPAIDQDHEIDRLLPLATAALQHRLTEDDFNLNAQLRFALHQDMAFNHAGDLVSEPTRTIDLNIKPENPDHLLVLHLDKSLFAELISGRMIWNLVVSGSQIMYERVPNIFYPTDTAALNFFVHRS